MSRYIKFDDAVKVMACEMYAEAQSQGYDVDGIEDFMPEAKAWLNDAPSIEIVRCKECKWRGIPTACPIDNFYAQRWTKDDDFCSYGERKDKCKECWHWSEAHKRCENKCGCQFKPYGEREDECIECHYEPKDECAKEYEELGLKELKELIEADRKGSGYHQIRTDLSVLFAKMDTEISRHLWADQCSSIALCAEQG